MRVVRAGVASSRQPFLVRALRRTTSIFSRLELPTQQFQQLFFTPEPSFVIDDVHHGVLFVLLEHLLDLLNRFQFTLLLIVAQEARPLPSVESELTHADCFFARWLSLACPRSLSFAFSSLSFVTVGFS